MMVMRPEYGTVGINGLKSSLVVKLKSRLRR